MPALELEPLEAPTIRKPDAEPGDTAPDALPALDFDLGALSLEPLVAPKAGPVFEPAETSAQRMGARSAPAAPAAPAPRPAPAPLALSLEPAPELDAQIDAEITGQAPATDVAQASPPPIEQTIEIGAVAPRRVPPRSEKPPAPPASGVAGFIEAAMRELEGGRVEPILWDSLLKQNGGDEDLTRRAYLRARATALQLERRKREHQAARQARAAAEAPARAHAFTPPRASALDALRRPAVLGGALAALLLLGGGAWWLLGNGTPAQDAIATAPAAKAAKAAKVAAAAQVAPQAAAPVVVDDGLAGRIASARASANWNVYVLLVTEWTRREPSSVDAWVALSDGFLHLKQRGEALDAANKATQLAPQNAAAWRAHALANLAVERPNDALVDFEHALAADPGDAETAAQMATVEAQLGRIADARTHFDKLLLQSPDLTTALCGQAYVMRQQGQGKDAEAIDRKLLLAGASCPEITAYVTARPGTVAASSSAARVAVPPPAATSAAAVPAAGHGQPSQAANAPPAAAGGYAQPMPLTPRNPPRNSSAR